MLLIVISAYHSAYAMRSACGIRSAYAIASAADVASAIAGVVSAVTAVAAEIGSSGDAMLSLLLSLSPLVVLIRLSSIILVLTLVVGRR